MTRLRNLLKQPGVNVDAADEEDGWTCLHTAARNGWLDLLDLLLSLNANVNALALSLQVTPLHEAAVHGRTSAAMRLLEAGADRNIMNTEGNTPAFAGLFAGHANPANMIQSKYFRC